MSSTTAPPIAPSTRRKAVLAASLGNFIEWFEYTLYGFFAAAIAMNFFPGGASSLIPTFAVFGVAFVLRPLGAITFGHFGDRIGRRTVLAVVIVGMSLATFVIGALPTYETAGFAAPVLLLLARAVQGFSAGGEFGGATAFMVEYAPPGRRSFYGSWQFFTQFLGALTASAFGTVLSTVLSEQAVNAWGWRIPFLLTLPLGLIGLYLRLKMDETPEFQRDAGTAESAAPLLVTVREHGRSVLTIIGMIISGTTATYLVQAFLPAYLVQSVGLPQRQVFTAMLIGLALLVGSVPLWALLADRCGRHKPFLVASPLATAIGTVPAFLLLLHGSFASTVAGYVLMTVLFSPALGSLATAMSDLFPTEIRYSGLSLAYGTAVSVFGGFTPLILASLADTTGSHLAPAAYLTGTAVISLTAALLLPETGSRAR
ncbi:MFS transporter [Saccharopolyspora sp. HNM0983]|uniref:Putative proline/betaine transporter n=1 Tax=Saccharopolyspora montiporae TaxID=2781240 RepID=A0A929B7Q8_9PSEU|nr:MFS transporter [Saccharopolyspora sp. HNM0983]MBE9372971.1 MFS transporter [Saccharopolyspora sp. HNM0983]